MASWIGASKVGAAYSLLLFVAERLAMSSTGDSLDSNTPISMATTPSAINSPARGRTVISFIFSGHNPALRRPGSMVLAQRSAQSAAGFSSYWDTCPHAQTGL